MCAYTIEWPYVGEILKPICGNKNGIEREKKKILKRLRLNEWVDR